MTNPVFEMMRHDDLRHDPWGTSLSWHFAVCELMLEWAPPDPPAEWGFRQAMGGPETDSFPYQEIEAMIESGQLDPNELLSIGQVLHRYEAMLERAGRSY